MNRRDFLKGMLAACAAPAIVRASSLMPVRPLTAEAYICTSDDGLMWTERAAPTFDVMCTPGLNVGDVISFGAHEGIYIITGMHDGGISVAQHLPS